MELTEDQAAILRAVREFVDRDVLPAVAKYDKADEFPQPLYEQMVEMGLFGLTIPEEYGGLGLDLTTYAHVVAELSRGWISLTGILNTHFMAAWMIQSFGTASQKSELLPRMATAEMRAAYSMTEPGAGSDVQAIRTRAIRDENGWRMSGQKMWSTNGLRSSIVMLLAVTDPDAEPRHKGMTAFIVRKQPSVNEQPGLTIPPNLKKLGYKGVETTELIFDNFRLNDDDVLGGSAGIGQGFKYFMAAVELGRVNVAARGVGVARCALEQAVRYAQERSAFGKKIAQHQAIQIKIAEMGTRLRAAELLTFDAARRKASGERADLEAGMAKLYATEAAAFCALEAMRIHGGYGYSQEFMVERLYRDAPLLILGEGTNEIQQLLIARRLIELHPA
ncbi:acyl-CoA dehydrogenase family protein [Chelatococcus asaccharovorans]|uniref:acyl-CoA dehydrogenase family protein n=1 Tax=Chelatococcus asaccharovorans TaxID=28210 RepID=UPI00224C65AB|nr:acyl-CoA dehydrogenase family protein [Chelatococcus asaccharovorans]CAH1655826.1 Acyl-CoA dehydrogenase [Chelatococcus asaccharovorans]CAH1685295.1 Acyl-CoA dehydrogenase [Chelatococcus asaccharovorans]